MPCKLWLKPRSGDQGVYMCIGLYSSYNIIWSLCNMSTKLSNVAKELYMYGYIQKHSVCCQHHRPNNVLDGSKTFGNVNHYINCNNMYKQHSMMN